MQVKAILFDTRSIQKYIFSNNRLRTNIGASYIVSHVFEDVLLKDILKPGAFGLQTIDTESWKNGKGISEGLNSDCYVAYIGGGNALLLFPKKGTDCRKAIVSAFTEKLLVTCPGLKIGAALGTLQMDSVKNLDSLDSLYEELKENQFTVFPRVNVANTGFTYVCEENGEIQETEAKDNAAEQADIWWQDTFNEVLNGYTFPKELNRLGQNETENEMAVVHIDGNNMGALFQKHKGIDERGRLSKLVTDKTQEAFKQLLIIIINEYKKYKTFLALHTDDQNREELPIRPLILGGDDITFICNARLALDYSLKFMELLADKCVGGMTINSCAGIAIVPTAYPFFRAYDLAEQLCEVAKNASRKYLTQGKEESSWLDFAILHGEQAPTIEQIREQEYKGALGDMHFGPYKVDGEGSHHYHINKLLQAAEGIKALPRNKYKEMRNVLQHDFHDIKLFMEQLQYSGNKLPYVPGWERYEMNVWDEWEKNSGEYKTPYIDAIEIIDYIPPKEER